MLYTAILVLKVIYLIGGRDALSNPDCIYNEYIYRYSGAAKVNPLYDKTRVKMDLRDGETRNDL
jgi:hypothetical protein